MAHCHCTSTVGGRRALLPTHHTVWRMMGSDPYGMAMEPRTNRDAGRWDARTRGELMAIRPGEIREYDLKVGALDGTEAIGGFTRRVERIAGAVPG